MTDLYPSRAITTRSIVRDPEILAGRWHFQGTTVAVADVRADFAAHSPQDGPYRFAGLSQAEVEEAMAFEFPSMRETAVQVDYMAVTVHCTCGEETHKTIIGPSHSVDCACRRNWRINVQGDDTTARAAAVLRNSRADSPNAYTREVILCIPDREWSSGHGR